MANRSYLYSSHPGDPNPIRDLSEWNYDVPISHFLLVSSNPTPIKTQLWSVEEKIAIQGEAEGARDLFHRFLDWIEPQLSAASAEIKAAREAILREDRQGEFYHLELGEIYDISGYAREEMGSACEADAKLAVSIASEVRNLLETSGSSMTDFEHLRLQDARDSWEESLGLYFPGILYFHMGK